MASLRLSSAISPRCRPELEWLANITKCQYPASYRNDVSEFSAFTGLRQPAELRTVTRAHVIAWRKHLESRVLAPSSIRRKLSAISALFDYLFEQRGRRQSGQR